MVVFDCQSQCIGDEFTLDGELFTVECQVAPLHDNLLCIDEFQPHGNSTQALLSFTIGCVSTIIYIIVVTQPMVTLYSFLTCVCNMGSFFNVL